MDAAVRFLAWRIAMSTIGTGVAAAVAQTAHNAQQVARRRDREIKEQDARREQMRELLEIHIQAVDEGDENDSPTRLRIGEQVPEHRQSHELIPEDQPRHDTRPAEPEAAEKPAPEPPRKHLDVTA
jgi:hypothetical protein